MYKKKKKNPFIKQHDSSPTIAVCRREKLQHHSAAGEKLQEP
jgi:hypothetical protein